MDDILVGVCYRPTDLEEKVDETFRQLGFSYLQVLVLVGDFHHPDISWRNKPAGHKQSGRFLECAHDNFLTQVTEKPMRGDVHKQEKTGHNVKAEGSFGTMRW